MLIHELPVYSPKKQHRKKIRGFTRRVRASCRVELPGQLATEWADLAHIHVDWRSYGSYSRRARFLFFQEYAKLFDHIAKDFMHRKRDFQLWIHINTHDSGQDAVFYHTPNPHSEFPLVFSDTIWSAPTPHLFTKLLPQYEMLEGNYGEGRYFTYYAKGIGVPLS